MKQVYFICGIDTDVGKTAATGVWARELAQSGVKVATQKLVQTGCTGIAADILAHRRIQGIAPADYDTDGTSCPFVFDYPCSPHLAAERAGRPIDTALIDAATQTLLRRFDTVLLEGAGGLMSPLCRRQTQLDFAAERGYPLVLVTSGRLGSINHTLLSLHAARSHGLRVARLVYNRFVPHDPIVGSDSENYLRDYAAEHFPECEWAVLPCLDGI